jgi:DNA-binding NarL/FixJ family response regulator/SAM-dependent methyltransferase
MIRVVVVDDEPMVCAHLRTILGSAPDIEVVDEAHDGAAGVEAVVRSRPDVVLMDLRMPVMDGIAAIERIGKLGHPPVVVVLTTFDADQYVLRALRAGAAGFLVKSTPPEDLIGLVRVAAEGHTVLSPAAARRLIAASADHQPARERARKLVSSLTEREVEVLGGLGQGLSNAQIAARLYLSEATVKGYVSRMLAPGKYSWPVYSPEGPSLRELTRQALSSVEGGYDLLAPKFDHTPFRTPDGVVDATEDVLRPLGPFGRGLDVCCGTGAGMRVLRSLCPGRIMGVDFSTGMLAQARSAHPDAEWVRADVRALPFAGAFDLAVSFGALGHFLPAQRPALFAGVYRALRPGGVFAFPIAAPQPITSSWYWTLLGFDLAMRVRNAVWRPPFVMYYRTCPLHAVRNDLTSSGFAVTTVPLTALGRREDGSPRCRLVLARRATPAGS